MVSKPEVPPQSDSSGSDSTCSDLDEDQLEDLANEAVASWSGGVAEVPVVPTQMPGAADVEAGLYGMVMLASVGTVGSSFVHCARLRGLNQRPKRFWTFLKRT